MKTNDTAENNTVVPNTEEFMIEILQALFIYSLSPLRFQPLEQLNFLIHFSI